MTRIAKPLLALLFAFVGHAEASAFLAKFPVALRQKYADGSYTELTCPDQRLRSCSFIAGQGAKSHKYAMDFGAYSASGLPQSYSVWIYPHLKVQSIAMAVDCAPEDLALRPGEDEAYVTCRLSLELDRDKFVPAHMEVWNVRQDGAPAYRSVAGA